MRNRVGSRLVAEQHHDEEVRPYIQQLMKTQSCYPVQTSEDNNSIDTVLSSSSQFGLLVKTSRVRGPTLLKDVWNLPPGKTIVVPFNSRNQSIGKEGRKLASFLGIIARTPDLTPLNANDWRVFDDEEKTTLVEFVKDMMKEKLSNNEILEEQSHDSVAWEGDVYSQVLGKEKSGYVHGLGLGPTPSLLWGSKSFLRNISVDGLCNEAAKKLEQEINELKELNKKQDEEMVLMRKKSRDASFRIIMDEKSHVEICSY
ncbi:hypothetical protein KY285_000196 [Solanum tuberosum]|nr:hypothetical protein KY285_000196 [Solanum tuberosum]